PRLAHPEHLREDQVRRVQAWDAEHDGAETPDLVLRGDRAPLPDDRVVPRAAVLHQREPLALWVLEVQGDAPVPLHDFADGDALFAEPGRPPLPRRAVTYPQ